MIKYLPTSGETLSTTRVSATDRAVVFEYNSDNLYKIIKETCQNMVKIAQDQNGNILVDEYSMDDDTPTVRMKQQMTESAVSDLDEHIFRLLSESNVNLGEIDVETKKTIKIAM